ncbi:aspartyl protease [Coleofasciculus sp. FACHB-1120]|uniref:aspartyl protease n=1 Tax=Coleofasciculus sp. FACHB-1120 TaxID=2692783 RepID=UPI0016830C4A|nr:aspartyl protease [Coleofasciculus sp. FACHB-1120]MBD2744516.1 aspartyl protease [Coleofasciculus sp. FACHB-1120]
MIQGEFDEIGQLFFEIDLISANGEVLPTIALLDTGSTEWLAINDQDLQGLGWSRLDGRDILTAMGETSLETYLGKVVLDGEEFTIEVVAGAAFRETLMGAPWLRQRQLVADFPAGLLTLGSS